MTHEDYDSTAEEITKVILRDCDTESSCSCRSYRPQKCRRSTKKPHCEEPPKEDCLLPQLAFKALGTAEQQVVDAFCPEKSTYMLARLSLEFDEGFTCVQFALSIKDGRKVTHAGLFYGKAGKPGVLVASLLYLPSGKNIDGTPIRGFLTNADINTDLQEQVINIASLYSALRAERLYFAVATEQFPDGVVRGQFYPK